MSVARSRWGWASSCNPRPAWVYPAVSLYFRLRDVPQRTRNDVADPAVFHAPNVGIDAADQVRDGDSHGRFTVELHVELLVRRMCADFHCLVSPTHPHASQSSLNSSITNKIASCVSSWQSSTCNARSMSAIVLMRICSSM